MSRTSCRIAGEGSTFVSRAVERIILQLYAGPTERWIRKFSDVSNRNAALRNLHDMVYGIHYKGHNYDIDEGMFGTPCLPLNLDDPQLVQDAEEVFEEAEQMKNERYQAKRFLAGLFLLTVMYDELNVVRVMVPLEKLQEALGSALYALVLEIFQQFTVADPSTQSNSNLLQQFDSFVNENTDILQAMQERMLINLIG